MRDCTTPSLLAHTIEMSWNWPNASVPTVAGFTHAICRVAWHTLSWSLQYQRPLQKMRMGPPGSLQRAVMTAYAPVLLSSSMLGAPLPRADGGSCSSVLVVVGGGGGAAAGTGGGEQQQVSISHSSTADGIIALVGSPRALPSMLAEGRRAEPGGGERNGGGKQWSRVDSAIAPGHAQR
jgi:hypothetical protein